MRLPNFGNQMFWGLAAPLLFIVFQLGDCLPTDARPESARNPAGTSHEVFAEVDGPPRGEWVFVFSIISGPNEGQTNIEECELEGLLGDEDFFFCLESLDHQFTDSESASWKYSSNGDEGTDYIAVCTFEALQITSLSSDSMSALRTQALDVQASATDEELEEDIEELESFGCDVVTKTWEDDDENERRPNVGGAFAGDGGAAERNRARANAAGVAAAVAVPVAPATTVRPPSTGDAGLAAD